ncbi:MAG: hypothetical protein QXU97_05260 [Fervidicoccaceae archaeon]
MESRRVVIIGAGPAGASLAYFLRGTTHEVAVHEGSPRLAARACGWVTPSSLSQLVKIHEEAILTEIDEIKAYLDGKELVELRFGAPFFLAVNKPLWLELLLEESGAELETGRRMHLYSLTSAEGQLIVIAAGSIGLLARALRARVIRAVQYLVELTEGRAASDVVEFWFDSQSAGYFWVFPRGGDRLSVGFGGVIDYETLWRRLEVFLARRFGGRARIIGRGGGPIAATGLKMNLLEERGVCAVGEAAGASLPLTGEGIRPSVITSLALARCLSGGRSYAEELEATGLPGVSKLHSAVLEALLGMRPEARAAVLRALPPELMIELALGSAKGGPSLRARIVEALASSGLLRLGASLLSRIGKDGQ